MTSSEIMADLSTLTPMMQQYMSGENAASAFFDVLSYG